MGQRPSFVASVIPMSAIAVRIIVIVFAVQKWNMSSQQSIGPIRVEIGGCMARFAIKSLATDKAAEAKWPLVPRGIGQSDGK